MARHSLKASLRARRAASSRGYAQWLEAQNAIPVHIPEMKTGAFAKGQLVKVKAYDGYTYKARIIRRELSGMYVIGDVGSPFQRKVSEAELVAWNLTIPPAPPAKPASTETPDPLSPDCFGWVRTGNNWIFV